MLAKIYDNASALFAEFEMFFVFLVFKFITFYWRNKSADNENASY